MGEPVDGQRVQRVTGVLAEHVALLWNLRCDARWTVSRRAEDVAYALCAGDLATAVRALTAVLAHLDPVGRRTALSLLELCRAAEQQPTGRQ